MNKLLSLMAATVLSLSATGFAAPAASAETLKEITCHSSSKVSFTHALHRLQNFESLIAVAEGNGTVTGDCGQGQVAPLKEQCFELSAQKNFSTVVQLMYCIDTDQDKDELVWKFAADDLVDAAMSSNGSSEIMMGSGKYNGVTGKGRIHCDYSGTMEAYTASCTNESAFRLP